MKKIVYGIVLVGLLVATYFVENWQSGLFLTGAAILFVAAKVVGETFRTKETMKSGPSGMRSTLPTAL
jgi:hypothetical protein